MKVLRLVSERVLGSDRGVQGLTAFVLAELMAIFIWPTLPHLWDEMAVAARLRPPVGALPGLWRGLLSVMYAYLPADAIPSVLRIMGLVSAAVLSWLVYSILDDSLPDILRFRMRFLARGRAIVRFILSVSTMFFMCNEAVWRSCQGFGTTTFHLLLALVGLRLVIGFFHEGGNWRLYVSMLIWGVMGADGPVGVVFGLVTLAAVYRKAFTNLDDNENPLANPIARRLVIGRMIRIGFVAWLSAFATNYWLYGWFGGVRAAEDIPTNIVVVCFGGFWKAFLSAVSPTGWMLAVGIVVAPFVVVLILLRKALTEDRFIGLSYAIVYLITGFISWSQLSGISCLWFRSWLSGTAVRDDFANAFFCFVGTVTLVWALSVLCKTFHFRGVRHIAAEQFPDAVESETGNWAILQMVQNSRYGRWLIRALPFLLVASALPMRGEWSLRRMLGIVDDYVKETVRESAGASRIFTDGMLDAAIELEAHRQGRRLLALSVFSGGSEYDIAVRQRDIESEEDLKALESGAADALRYWTNEFPERLEDIAVQVGFERWKNAKIDYRLVYSGVLARFSKEGDDMDQEGIGIARALGDRIIDVYEYLYPDSVTDRRARQLFRFVQWRLSHLCRVRADILGATVWGTEENRDEVLCKKLDELNAELQSISKRVGWMSEHHGAALLPREGLRLGLERADFRMAKSFAEIVLRSDPDDASANFAIGMFYLMDGQYARSEAYLERSLKRRSEDAAVLNNLSVVALRLNRPLDALRYAERAAKAAPESREIVRTLKRAQEAVDRLPPDAVR